ncbi:MAG: ABC transporter ATP-binding protein [Phycisphaerales bacterium]|nr:MAG: ABC transporter ATP-binding protein [Phycisphaerales bacterium]
MSSPPTASLPDSLTAPARTAIECHDVHKVYAQRRKEPVHALRGLDLTVRTGECFGLLGPNGAGKTTTVEILEGLLEPTSGTVEVLGLQWGRHDARLRQRIGISLQETRLEDKLTALETVRLFRSFYRSGPRPEEVVERVGLTEKRRSYVEHLSGGQRQRLAVACALVGDPELLFLDEPTTGLDPQARRDVWEIIRDQRRRGRTVMVTTHYMDEAHRLCDRVAVVDHGRVIALGTPDELIHTLGGGHVIEFSLENGRPALDAARLAQVAGVRTVTFDGPSVLLAVDEPHVALPALMRHLDQAGAPLQRLTTRHASLEDVFVKLTGRHLRDDGG